MILFKDQIFLSATLIILFMSDIDTFDCLFTKILEVFFGLRQ